MNTNDFEIPKKQELTLCAYLALWDWLDEPKVIFIIGSKKNNHGYNSDVDYIFIEEIKIDVPFKTKGTIDIKSGLIEVLGKKKKDIIARNHMELKEVEDKLNELLCIEYNTENDNEVSA